MYRKRKREKTRQGGMSREKIYVQKEEKRKDTSRGNVLVK